VTVQLERHVLQGVHSFEGAGHADGPERSSGPSAVLLVMRVGQAPP
jgi:hypothetical protein